MSFFWWKDDLDEDIQVYFSQCKNGQWVGEDRRIVKFDYLDNYDLFVAKREVEEDTWNMLLQVLNLEVT